MVHLNQVLVRRKEKIRRTRAKVSLEVFNLSNLYLNKIYDYWSKLYILKVVFTLKEPGNWLPQNDQEPKEDYYV